MSDTVSWVANPVTALALFGAVVGGIYRLSGRWSARGEDAPGKHLPYACGEDLAPEGVQLSYHAFFRLALMFVVAHMATLVLATLPSTFDARLLATAYLLGIGVCIDVLVRGVD